MLYSSLCIQYKYFTVVSSNSLKEKRKCLLYNTQVTHIPANLTVASSSQIWLFLILWQNKALQTLSLPRGMLTLVRSTWPNQQYYKTLGKCYIGVLLIHSIALTGHDCVWKIWLLASLLTYWDSSLLLRQTGRKGVTWLRAIPESLLLPKHFIYKHTRLPTSYWISTLLLEILQFSPKKASLVEVKYHDRLCRTTVRRSS